MKNSKTARMVASILTLAILAGLIPTAALAAEDVQEPTDQVDEVIIPTADPMLGMQSGVGDIQEEASPQPRSREELLALDSVILSEDGEPVAIQGTEDNITLEEKKILFSSATSYGLLDESDPNQELREEFGLTDADIEQGSNLHGSRLTYTSELSSLVMKAKDMNMSEAQVADLAELISSGYSCYHAMRVLAAKDLFAFTMDELKAARQQEIQEDAQKETEEAEQEDQEEQTDESTPPSIAGLPTSLAERAVEMTGEDAQSIERDITAAMRQAYSSQPSDEESALMAVASSGGITYAPEEVLGQPYRYAEQGNFNVNLNTGSYSYSETDLSIPGKNDLDLVLTRQYHSDRANTKENLSVIYNDRNIIHRDMFRVHYRWYEHGSVEPQEIVNQENYYATDSSTANLISTAWIFAFDDYESAVHQKAAMAAQGISTAQVFDRNGREHLIDLLPAIEIIDQLTFEEYVYDVARDDSFYVDEFGLGHGWMLGLSHLRWIHYGNGELDNSRDRRIQITLSDGTRYMAESFLTSGNGIENYTGDDIRFCECTSAEYLNAAYALRYKDGRVEYFDVSGQNIAIRDRFGNTIAITYMRDTSSGKVKKIQIEDTLRTASATYTDGNLVVYEEVPLDDTQLYTVETPSGSTQYNKMWKLSLNGETVRKYYSYAQNLNTPFGSAHPVTLVAVENEVGELTTYTSECITTCYNCFLQPNRRNGLEADEKMDSTDGYDVLVAMHKVEYPNQGTEKIWFSRKPVKSFSGNGYCHYIRCDEVTLMNSVDNKLLTNIQYTYGDFDNLEMRQHYRNEYATTEKYINRYPKYHSSNTPMPWTEREFVYTFNSLAQNTKVEKSSYNEMPFRQDGISIENQHIYTNQYSWKSQVTEYQYASDKPLWPEAITTTYTDNISNQKITREETYSYDTKGNVLTYKKPNGQTETYNYDPTYSLPLTTTLWQNASTKITTTNTLSTDKKSILTTETKSNDVTVSKSVYSYDSFGQVTVQNDYKDAEHYVTTNYSYNYATSALPVQVSVAGVKTANGEVAAGSPGFAAGTVAHKQSYNKRGWLMSETDANGKTTSYSYDAVGRLTGVTFPDGTGLSYSYTVASTSMVTYTDQAGNQWRCAYGKSGKLKTVTDLTTNQLLQSNTYDREDRLVKQVIYGGSSPDQTTYYRYDTDGRLIELERVDNAGNTIYQELYQYEDGSGKVTKTVTGDANAPSVVTTSYQDNMGNVVKTGIFRNGVEEIDTFAYDYLGNQTQSKTAFSASKKRAYTTQTAYDHAGRVLSTTNTMGKTSYKTYDWLGNQLTDKDLKGNVTTMTYDVLGRLLRTSTPMDSKQTSQTDYIYDPNGNVTREKVLTGSSTARITDYIYDSLGRLAQVKGNAKQEGQTGADQFQYTNYTYDALGNIKTMSIGSGTNWHTTQYTYDRYSRLTQYKDALNQAESYSYDLNGNLTSKTDRRGVTTANTYDAMGRLTESTAGQDSLAFTYTKTSQRRTATSNGQTTTYTYDEVGNLVKEVTPVATKTMSYGIGGLRSQFVVAVNGKTYLTNTYDYDPMGRMSKVDGKGFGAASAHYSYGTSGKLVSVTYGNDTEAHYTYNKANLPTEVKTGLGSYPGVPLFQYTYGRDGNQISKTDDRGSYTTYAYDGLNRLVEENQTGTLGNFSKSYAYDAFGNRQSMTVDGKTTNYTYDANNRLLSTTGWETASYTYDVQGNMTQAVFGTGATATCTYDGFNRLEKVSDNSGETVYTYDADGLRSSSNESQYVWDQGRLVATIASATVGGMLISDFTLPEDGCRTVQMSPLSIGTRYYAVIGGTTRSAVAKYVKGEPMRARVTISGEEKPEIPPVTPYDRVILDFGSVAMEMEYPASGSGQADVYVVGFKNAHVKLYNGAPTGGSSEAESTVYIRGLSLIYGGSLMNSYNYHYDAHGNVVQLSRGRGAVSKDYYYDAFGVEQNADPADTNPFRYCGEQYDTETGNYYLRARYYAPGVGRFTQEDPIRDGLNWYAYCGGNPVGFVDPSGMQDVLLRYIAEKNDASIEIIQKRVSLFGFTIFRYGLDSVKVSIGDKSVSYSGKIIEGRMVVDSDQFGEDFGITDSTKLTHQAGDLFNSVNDAAIAWALIYNKMSIEQGIEYGGLIYEQDNKYAFGVPLAGDNKSVEIVFDDIGNELQAIIHSHAVYDEMLDSENFSPADKRIALQANVPIYVSTPEGYLKQYSPFNGGVKTISGGMPRDPNAK